MKHRLRTAAGVVRIAVTAVIATLASSLTVAQTSDPGYIENRGQWDGRARFLLQARGVDTWVTDRGVVYDLFRAESSPANDLGDEIRGGPAPVQGSGHAVELRFEGASAEARAIGAEQLEGVHNYFIGRDSARWAIGVRRYARVGIAELYPGIDALFYVDGGRPRYDLVVAPGADPSRVRMRFVGATSVSVAPEGVLRIGTSLGDVEHRGLVAYQQTSSGRRRVACGFARRDDGSVSFSIGEYDRTLPLVIDPIVWATLYGGSRDDDAAGIAVDARGDVYIAGSTDSRDLPTGPIAPLGNPIDGTYADSVDAFVAKLVNDGRSYSYATYLGSRGVETAHGIAVDSLGQAFVAGSTRSAEFPANGQYKGGFTDMFVTKLNARGTAYLFSTFIGGRSYEEAVAIAADRHGNAYITGPTSSDDYPTGGFDGSYNGPSWDIAVTKLDANGSRVYSTYLGGTRNDNAYAIAVDSSGSAYIGGYTDSDDYPTTIDAYDRSFNGAFDAVVTKLNPAGTRLGYSTYLGAGGDDFAMAIAAGDDGAAWVGVMTRSQSFPTTQGAFDTKFEGISESAVVRFDRRGAALEVSTLLGGRSDERTGAITVDSAGRAYFAGSTRSTDFPTTSDAARRTPQGFDGFVTVVDRSGAVLHSTLVGGGANDEVGGIARSADGTLYLVGTTDGAIATTPDAFDATPNGGRDLFVMAMTVPAGGIGAVADDARPLRSSASPNPTRGATTIRYGLQATAGVRITIHDALGRAVATVADAVEEPGAHEAVWHGVDAAGMALPAGRYSYRISAGAHTEGGAIVLVR